jgi:D-glucosaminate-6-phosphate ammonia-lyase
MDIYRKFGVSPIINAAGTLTRLGGSLMLPEVESAMSEAAGAMAPIEQLQAAASAAIAAACGSEAGYVVSGAAAGLTLAAAACMVGTDVVKMGELPFAANSPDEIIICRSHRNSYDHAFRTAGARLTEVGVSDRYSGAGVREVEPWEIEAAISEKTAAIAYTAGADAQPSLPAVSEVAKRHRIPIIVDAAAQLPPPENLRRFINQGADLVAFSGGKALRGPQGTGLLAGRRDLIASVALQHLDMDVTFSLWHPPETLISKKTLKGAPRHGLGRGFKVSKEQIIGVLVALELFTLERCRLDRENWKTLLSRIENGIKHCENINIRNRMPRARLGYPLLEIQIDEKAFGKSAEAVAETLRSGNPPIYVGEMKLMEGAVLIHPANLDAESADLIIARLNTLLNE